MKAARDAKEINYAGIFNLATYPIQQLDDKELASYATLVVGNDPIIYGLEKYKAKEGKIAIVGLSGMRMVLLACQLGNAAHIPQVILVENSQQVIKFWQGMVELAKVSLDEKTFLAALQKFLQENPTLYHSPVAGELDYRYPDQDIMKFFIGLLKDYGYPYIQEIFKAALIIKQSWEDEETFKQIKAMLTAAKIDKDHTYAFPSNVVSFMMKWGMQHGEKVLANIASLDPCLAIHADLHGGLPRNVYLLENQTPAQVKKELCIGISTDPLPEIPDGKVVELQDLPDDFVFDQLIAEQDKLQDANFDKAGVLFKRFPALLPHLNDLLFQEVNFKEGNRQEFIKRLGDAHLSTLKIDETLLKYLKSSKPKEIIAEVKTLAHITQFYVPDNRLKFLERIDDNHLKMLIKNSHDLKVITQLLPEDEQAAFAKKFQFEKVVGESMSHTLFGKAVVPPAEQVGKVATDSPTARPSKE